MKLSLPSVEPGSFASEFADAVRTGLSNLVGESGTQAVMFYTDMPVGRLEPAEVDRRLVALFGEQATVCIEREIILDLLTRLDLPLEAKSDGNFDFVAIVQAAKKAASTP